jgi:hypothetical protein
MPGVSVETDVGRGDKDRPARVLFEASRREWAIAAELKANNDFGVKVP